VPGQTYFIALPRKKFNVSVDDRHKCEITKQERHEPILTVE
jgi:hypothetical protein